MVQEPPQPSIKLKLNAPTPKEPLPRKIIIRAPGSRAESPGPATGQSAGSMADGTASDTVMTPALAKSDPASSAVQSPSVQVKTTEMVAARDSASPEDDSPAPEANGQPQPVPETAAPPSPPQPSPESIIAAKLAKLYSTKHRLAGRGTVPMIACMFVGMRNTLTCDRVGKCSHHRPCDQNAPTTSH